VVDLGTPSKRGRSRGNYGGGNRMSEKAARKGATRAILRSMIPV